MVIRVEIYQFIGTQECLKKNGVLPKNTLNGECGYIYKVFKYLVDKAKIGSKKYIRLEIGVCRLDRAQKSTHVKPCKLRYIGQSGLPDLYAQVCGVRRSIEEPLCCIYIECKEIEHLNGRKWEVLVKDLREKLNRAPSSCLCNKIAIRHDALRLPINSKSVIRMESRLSKELKRKIILIPF